MTDTRGLTTTKTITKTLVNYFKPTITLDSTIKIDSLTNTAGVDINVSGKCYSGTFGNNEEQSSTKKKTAHKKQNQLNQIEKG